MKYKIQYKHIHHGARMKCFCTRIEPDFKIHTAQILSLSPQLFSLSLARILLRHNPPNFAFYYKIIPQ